MRQYVLHHHEFIDGSGYPDGLAGDNIPLGARIILVADAYDAMTSDRPYRRSIGHERAMNELRKHAGQQFDSSIVETLPVAVGQNGELAQSCLPENITGLSFSAINPGQLAKFHPG
jgi:HD-GYP domain-containing protein (c-di-GMP phosphodiesterase class II)